MMIQFYLATGTDRPRARETLSLRQTCGMQVTKSRFSHDLEDETSKI